MPGGQGPAAISNRSPAGEAGGACGGMPGGQGPAAISKRSPAGEAGGAQPSSAFQVTLKTAGPGPKATKSLGDQGRGRSADRPGPGCERTTLAGRTVTKEVPMLPWKMFFRFFSALVLMATGGFAAGHDLPIPFATAPTEAAAPPAAPVADPSTTTTTAPVADSAPPAVDDTTTTAPAPVVAAPVSDPAPVVPPTGPAPTNPLN